MNPDIQNQREMCSTAIPTAFHEKSRVNFGAQTKKFYWLELSHPSVFFGGDYISALRGCCPLKVLYALEIDSAHQNGDEGSPKQKILIVKV